MRELIGEWWEVGVMIQGESVPLSSGRPRRGTVPAGAYASAKEAREQTAHWAGGRTVRRVRRYRGSSGDASRLCVAYWWEVDGRPAYDALDAREAVDRARRRGRRGRLVRVTRYIMEE